MAMCAAVDIGFLPRRMTFFSAWSLFLGRERAQGGSSPTTTGKERLRSSTLPEIGPRGRRKRVVAYARSRRGPKHRVRGSA